MFCSFRIRVAEKSRFHRIRIRSTVYEQCYVSGSIPLGCPDPGSDKATKIIGKSHIFSHEIAKIQHQAQTEFLEIPHQYNLLDTDLLTIKIWLDDKFEKQHSWIEEEIIKSADKTLYVLCLPDFAWHWDKLREDENRRDEITQLYRDAFTKYKLDYINVNGSVKNRESQVLNHIKVF